MEAEFQRLESMTITVGNVAGRHGTGAVAESLNLIQKHEAGREGER